MLLLSCEDDKAMATISAPALIVKIDLRGLSPEGSLNILEIIKNFKLILKPRALARFATYSYQSAILSTCPKPFS